ncbi:DUF563 domain-containing protein [Halorubrum sp. Ea1]|uniref:glycosyltransferase family 61 protein n=1 Tax=Halorubrum sp. Ea1 TaxID=1480718 RepID=UPI00159537B1|nr:glycosyltransferase family 61 protein [Halorubrum sp. Ea1]
MIEDVLFYRLVYRRILCNRVDILSREALPSQFDPLVSEPHDGSMRIKAAAGFRDRQTPAGYDPGDRFVCEIPDTTLLGPAGPGLTAAGTVVADTVATPPLETRRIGVALAQSMRANGVRRTLSALSGDADPDSRLSLAALAVPPWTNYYHWTAECLIRIRLLEAYADAKGQYPTLLIPANPPAWVEESLSIVDYAGEVQRWDGSIAAVETLVVPTFPDPTPTECAWLRNRMRQSVSLTERDSERIYVGRGDATVRRVANRDELQKVLDRYNINTYLLGNLSVREQINLFSRAELVVGPHGAGLTNILFGDNLTLVELFGDKQIATFDRLAAALDHAYIPVYGEQTGVDIHVNTDKLDSVIAESLGK